MTPSLRPARVEDVPALVELVNHAGEGLPLYLWEQMAEPGETGWDVGRRRAIREEGAFSWRNATVLDAGDGPVGCIVGYPLPEDPPPPEDVPAMFAPLDALERLAAGTWYVNMLAIVPEARGHGHGSTLLNAAAEKASAGGRGLSLIVSDANEGARRFYRRHGFAEVDARAMVKNGWRHPGERWILMLRPV